MGRPEGFALRQYLDELALALGGHVSEAANRWEENAVHQSRVLSRRLEAAVMLIKPIVEPRVLIEVRWALRKIRQTLGPHRDIDVMLSYLREELLTPVGAAASWLSVELERKRQRLRDDLPRKFVTKVTQRLRTWKAVSRAISSCEPALEHLIADAVNVHLDEFSRHAQQVSHPAESQHTDPHELRKAGKRLRYTLELAGEHGTELPGGVIKNFKKLQDDLGRWHDQVVLGEVALKKLMKRELIVNEVELAMGVTELSRLCMERSSDFMGAFVRHWNAMGADVEAGLRLAFPLSKPISVPVLAQLAAGVTGGTTEGAAVAGTGEIGTAEGAEALTIEGMPESAVDQATSSETTSGHASEAQALENEPAEGQPEAMMRLSVGDGEDARQ